MERLPKGFMNVIRYNPMISREYHAKIIGFDYPMVLK